MGKPWMFCDVEILISHSIVIFRYKLEHRPVNQVINPSAEWLAAFASEDKPYEICPTKDWTYAWNYTIAKEAEPRLNAFLKEKKFMTVDDVNDILDDVIKKYYPNMTAVMNSDDYMAFVDLKNAESGWVLKGE